MGIDTGVDLDALIEVGRMAEDIVGHQLPGELIHAGSLDAFRRGSSPNSDHLMLPTRTESSSRERPSSPQKISKLCSPISGARREISQGEP